MAGFDQSAEAKTGGFEVRKEPGKSVFIRRKATGRKASSRVSGAA